MEWQVHLNSPRRRPGEPTRCRTAAGSVGRAWSAGSPELPSLNIWFHLVASDILMSQRAKGVQDWQTGCPCSGQGLWSSCTEVQSVGNIQSRGLTGWGLRCVGVCLALALDFSGCSFHI